MKRKIAYLVALIIVTDLVAAFFLAGKGRASQPGAAVSAQAEPSALVAAPGRVERGPALEKREAL